jgi:hypothetical protein
MLLEAPAIEFEATRAHSNLDKRFEPAKKHALTVEGHSLRLHAGDARVFHDGSVDAVAICSRATARRNS